MTSFDQQLHAVSPEGAARWTFQTDGQILSSPLVGPDGNLYFGSRDHHLYAVSPTGKLLWKFRTGDEVDSDPALTAAGEVAFGSDDGNLYVLSRAGRAALVVSGRRRDPRRAAAAQRRQPGARHHGRQRAGGGAARPEPAACARPGVLARVPLGRGRVGPALLLARAASWSWPAPTAWCARCGRATASPSWSVRVSDSALGQPLAARRRLLRHRRQRQPGRPRASAGCASGCAWTGSG